ncbi:MAG: ABC transporter permease [Chloroflexota bacterium]|nr:FtsX-like permease family protein [Anaerolineales bacterium]
MNALQLAWKNISGNAFRNGVVSLCALLLAAFTLFITLVIRGAESSLRLTIDRLGADIVVVPEGSEAKIESALLMGVPARFWMPKEHIGKLAAIPGVEVVSPQLYLATLTGASCCSVSDMFMIAYDPATDFTVQPWLEEALGNGLRVGEVVGGSYISATEGDQNIKVYGYLVTLKENLEPTGTGLDQTMFLTFDTAYDIASKSAAQAKSQLVIPDDSISAALIKVKPGSDPHAVAVQILQSVPGVTPIESSNLFQSYRRQMNGLLKSILVILSVTWGLSVVLIGLVFSMAANERRKELGVLRALGATKRFVFQSLLAEASLLALFGGATGLVVASLAIYLFRKLIMVSLEIPFLLPSPISLLLQIGVGLLLALFSVNLAALLPAYKISRQDPAVAMRE